MPPTTASSSGVIKSPLCIHALLSNPGRRRGPSRCHNTYMRCNEGYEPTDRPMLRRHILVCAPRLFEPGATGGGERYTTEFIRAMEAREDVTVTVLSGLGYGSLQYRRGLRGEPAPIAVRSVRGLVARADVVHVFQLDSHVADLALAAGVRTATPVVLSDLGGGWRSVGRLLGRSRHRAISGLAAISETSVEDLGWDSARPMTVLYGGGDHLPLSTATPPDSRRYDVVFVARLIPHKGAHLLLEALPDGVSCLIAGAPMQPDYFAQLEVLARGRDVTFRPGASDEDVAGIYRSGRWSVSPTLAQLDGKDLRRPELLGLSAIESMTLGTPAILSDIPAFAELARLTGMPTFRAGDSTSLRRVLEESQLLAQSPTARNLNKLTWAGVAAQAVAFYGSLPVKPSRKST